MHSIKQQLTCKRCGREFLAHPSKIERGQKYCSLACRYPSPAERFWAKADRPNESACWTWRAGIDSRGYGQFYFRGKNNIAHRIAYELVKGPIPAGLVIDHLCRNPLCVNPAHLEAVTNRENMIRGESPSARQFRAAVCKYGHPLQGDNVISTKSGRRCRECERERWRQSYQRRKAAG